MKNPFNCGCQEGTVMDDVDDTVVTKSTYRSGAMDLIATVPEGFREGDLIIVKSPFGTRQAQVVIPPGVSSGEKFHVTLPHPSLKVLEPESPTISNAVENLITPTPIIIGEPMPEAS